jgi:hypothetical protein
MTVQWYFRRIRKLLLNITNASYLILPSNRKAMHAFAQSWQVQFIEWILCGLTNVDMWDNTSWDSDTMFLRFKDYVIDSEQEIQKRLRGVNYYIDDANTLNLTAGAGRPEKVDALGFSLLPRFTVL